MAIRWCPHDFVLNGRLDAPAAPEDYSNCLLKMFLKAAALAAAFMAAPSCAAKIKVGIFSRSRLLILT